MTKCVTKIATIQKKTVCGRKQKYTQHDNGNETFDFSKWKAEKSKVPIMLLLGKRGFEAKLQCIVVNFCHVR